MNTLPNILVIYTGGTIGMKSLQTGGALRPSSFDTAKDFPFLKDFPANLVVESLPEIKDSSDISTKDWLELSTLIWAKKNQFDAFVVLHGTDTMTYAGTAQSFLLSNLHKAVIFTGAQIPLSASDSDGEDNFIGAIEFAAVFAKKTLKNTVVGIYFDGRLLQANRTVKYSSFDLSAFQSPNFEELGIRSNGVQLFENHHHTPFNFKSIPSFSNEILTIKIHPNMNEKVWVDIIEQGSFKGILLETFGSGNIPNNLSLLNSIENAINKGCWVLNVSQCLHGNVDMKIYEAGKRLEDIGVIGGMDITFEAALVKLMISASLADKTIARTILCSPIAGELSLNSEN